MSEPETLYRVCWRMKSGEFEGNGSPLKKEIAQAHAEHCNQKYPETLHWIEPTIPHLEQLLRGPCACPSNHWNNGLDVCADCGADLS